jgi:hypothetical protein
VFNLIVPVEDVLKARGWVVERESGDRILFRRPGKGAGVSASVKDGTVWVFTSSISELPASAAGGKPYTAFALIAHLEYGGDFTRAARELTRAGYGTPPGTPGPGLPARQRRFRHTHRFSSKSCRRECGSTCAPPRKR